MTAPASGGRPSGGPPTVLVVDDHLLVRAALVAALRDRGLPAHGCPATTIDGILAEAAKHEPGVVLLDLDLGPGPDGMPVDGVDAVAPLRAAHWTVVIVSAAAGPHRARVAAAVAAGAHGQVPKSSSFDELIAAVAAVASGSGLMSDAERRSWLALHLAERDEARRRAALLRRLTARERFVLERLADGRRAVEIADEHVVSVTTVRSQIRAILAKLEVSSQLGAVALLQAHRLDSGS